MTANLSAEVRAVVRAFDGLTTQVRRIADALSTPVVEQADGASAPVVSVHGACHLSPEAREALDALIDVATRAVTNASSAQQTDFALAPTPPDDASTTPVACPLCPITVHLTTPDQATAHFRNKHPDERLTLWPWLVRMPTAGGPRCVQCGSPDVRYRNYREQPFCWPCANGEQAPAADEDAQRTARRNSATVLLARGERMRLTTEEVSLLRQHFADEARDADTARRTIERMKRTNRMVNRGARESREQAERAEAAIERVRALLPANPTEDALIVPVSYPRLRAALDGTERPTEQS